MVKFPIEDEPGTKKKGVAAWDRPLPPLPKTSPYENPLPFMTSWVDPPKVNKNVDKIGRWRNFVQPQQIQDNTDNATKKPWERPTYYCSIRKPVVKHPDTLKQMTGFTSTYRGTKPIKNLFGPEPRINHSVDLAFVARDAKTLYTPHGIPPQVDKLRFLISYPDGLSLRHICLHVQQQHWAYIDFKKLEFRERVWDRCHIERIRDGPLRDSFIYTFATYLPYNSHLPIYHQRNALPF